MLLALLVLPSLAICVTKSTEEIVEPLVLTKSGWVRGLRATDGDYTMFMGIPYAKVNPDNPFGNAIPSPKFEGVFDAFDDTAMCPQIEEFNNTIVGTLDCLHVNVYVPNSARLDPTIRLPVLLSIFGGSFEIGFAGRYVYGPKYMVRHDVILVTFNYRLGPYGFMCLDIPEVPGNQGLKDQQLAFAWIKENIESFGGDPDRITVFGNSSGGVCIDLHLSSKGLPFRNAVMQSGAVMKMRLLQDSNPDVPLKIAQQVGYRPRNVYEALHTLAMLPPATVIDAAFKIGIRYLPCAEKVFYGVDNFITEYNFNISRTNGMNILVGFTDDERLKAYSFVDEHFFKNWDVINENLRSEFYLENELRDKLAATIRQFYIGDDDITGLVKRSLMDYESDWYFYHPTERAINKYFKNEVQKLYFYMFTYTGERNFVKKVFNITEGGAAHADELGYLFDMQLKVITEPPTPNDQLVLDRMTVMWTNFAKYDDPTPELNSLLPVKWEPVSKDYPRFYTYMHIDRNLTLSCNPFDHRMRFWDIFFEEYGKYEK